MYINVLARKNIRIYMYSRIYIERETVERWRERESKIIQTLERNYFWTCAFHLNLIQEKRMFSSHETQDDLPSEAPESPEWLVPFYQLAQRVDGHIN